RHLTKQAGMRAIYRGSGSVGIVGMARTGLLLARHPADPDLRVLSGEKSNLSADAPSLGFRVKSDAAGRPVIEWAGPVDLTADELGRKQPEKLRPRDRAMDWLKRELAGGPRRSADLYAAAAEAGIPAATLRREEPDTHVAEH